MADDESNGLVSSGVEALIERLRREGVEAGQERARRIVEDAEARARTMVRQAADEAERIKREARRENEREREALSEAVRVAVRDAVLDLRTQLSGRFKASLGALVAEALVDRDLLGALLRELAGQAREDLGEAEMTVKLPREAIGYEELSRDPQALAHSELTELVRGISADMLREGVRLELGDPDQTGLVIQLADGAVELEFTEETVTRLLLAHLQPRFRALVEGVVR